MDDGADCADILMTQLLLLRRDYIAVVSCSQKEFQHQLVYSSDRALFFKCDASHVFNALAVMLMHLVNGSLPDLNPSYLIAYRQQARAQLFRQTNHVELIQRCLPLEGGINHSIFSIDLSNKTLCISVQSESTPSQP